MVTPFHPCVADSSHAQHDGLSPNLASHRERCDNLHRVRREQIFREAASRCSTSALRAGSPYKPALAADVSNAVFSLSPRPTEAQSKKTYRSKYNAEMVLTGHPCFRASLFFFFWKGHPSLAAVAVPSTSAARQRAAWKRSIEALTQGERARKLARTFWCRHDTAWTRLVLYWWSHGFWSSARKRTAHNAATETTPSRRARPAQNAATHTVPFCSTDSDSGETVNVTGTNSSNCVNDAFIKTLKHCFVPR